MSKSISNNQIESFFEKLQMQQAAQLNQTEGAQGKADGETLFEGNQEADNYNLSDNLFADLLSQFSNMSLDKEELKNAEFTADEASNSVTMSYTNEDGIEYAETYTMNEDGSISVTTENKSLGGIKTAEIKQVQGEDGSAKYTKSFDGDNDGTVDVVKDIEIANDEFLMSHSVKYDKDDSGNEFFKEYINTKDENSDKINSQSYLYTKNGDADKFKLLRELWFGKNVEDTEEQ